MNLFEKAAHLYNHASTEALDDQDIQEVIDWPLESLSVLFGVTDTIRRDRFGNIVEPCSIMNIKSGGCSEDCAFCTQSVHATASIDITGLVEPLQIRERLAVMRNHHLPLSVVSSGQKLSRSDLTILCTTLKGCSGEKHASLGTLDKEELVMLRDAGVVWYHHNLETSRSFFPAIVSTHTWEERAATVRLAKSLGFRVCCGGIFGVGETWNDRRAFALELKALDVDSIPVNFFNPLPGTRVKAPKESPLEFLKIIALYRLVMPSKIIKVCGGREYHLGPLQALIFPAGANGYISGGYLTSGGAGVDADDVMIGALGLRKQQYPG